MIEQRIGRLDVDLQEVLTTASVEGEQFTVEVVAQVQGMATAELVRRLSRVVDKEHRLVQAQGSQYVSFYSNSSGTMPSDSGDSPETQPLFGDAVRGLRLSRYQFRHNVIQKYLYNGLDEVERAYLHEAVGHTLEELYGGQAELLEAHLEALAYHFYAAGRWSKALAYAQRAGEKALALQAPQDAITQFTQALDAAAQQSQQPSAPLYRLRGQAFDTLGHFDRARADYEAAQDAADAVGDQRLMWQTLLDLGQLWAARDYNVSRGYCQQALDLARAMDDQAAIGHSLNRLGNWLMNTGQPFEAFACHREAFDHFDELKDQSGIAATLDRLAATSFFCGNAAGAVAYYRQAIPILRDLDDHQALVSCLANLATDTLDERLAREAVHMAQEIEWRAGEAFALHNLGALLSFRGDYGQGLTVTQNGLEVAQAIGHRVWQAACDIDLGVICLALLAFDEARHHLESGLETAKDVGSTIMITYASGFLAALYIQLEHFDEAARLLPELPVEPIMGQDHWLVRPAAQQAHIEQGAAQALHLLDQQALPDRSNWLGWLSYFYGAIPQLRGELLTELGRFDEAETVLTGLLALYQEQGVRMDLWRVHLALGEVYQATNNLEGAQAAFAAARTIVKELAATVTDDALRDHFHRQALDLISTASIA